LQAERVAPEPFFADAMSALVSGVAVITVRRRGGAPCGLLATAVSSFSASPPSLLVAIDHGARSYRHLLARSEFGVHLLSADQADLAEVFAGRSDDKFAGLAYGWQGDVPVIPGALVCLRCRRSAVFAHYDHSVLIGDVVDGSLGAGEPLVYARRRLDWKLA